MSSAGFQLVAGRIPGERVATSILTSDSSGFTTTETTIQSVTGVPVVSGRTYRVRAHFTLQSTNAGDVATVRIRADNTSGALVQSGITDGLVTGSLGPRITIEGEFVATTTESKTFVLTGVRLSGSGTINRDASASNPSYLYVDFIR